VAELATANHGGKAETEWTYHYKHDPEKPLTEKPKYYFIATSQRCKEAKSGNMEIGMQIDIPVCYENGECLNELDYKLTGVDGSEETGTTGQDGRIQSRNLLPANYEVEIMFGSNGFSASETQKLDFASLPDGCQQINAPSGQDDITLKLAPHKKYAVVVSGPAKASR
jgi:hypothetical protein